MKRAGFKLWQRRGFLGLTGALLGRLFLAACAMNPVKGRRQFVLMTEGQEIQMGRDADPEIVGSMGLVPDQALQDYVQELGARLAAQSERPDLPWTFRVLDDPLINAFALPGGFIYVTRGILAHFESEAELAGVLGHEIGHVTARHSVGSISQAQLAAGVWGLGSVFVPELQEYEALAGVGLQLAFLKFSRDHERQADQLGVRYMAQVGYDPAQLSGVMAMLGRVTSEGGGGRAPEWLSTHPNPENREGDILALAGQTPVMADPPLVRREEYLPRLDGMAFGVNPREGYFQGESFLHPELAFQLDFPAGWETVNSKEAVQAVSPEEDAILVLTLAEGGTPRAAAQSFLSQDGVSGGPAAERTLNGLPAAWADFNHQSGEESLEGRVTFVSHQGTLYRVLGVASAAAWKSRNGVVRESLDSFRPLTDPAALNVQPARLRIVTVRRAMDLDSFLRPQGGESFADQVRILNRLEGNPTLRVGQKLKVPTGGRLPSGG